MKTDDQIKLLPCPFCGSEAEDINIYHGEEIVRCASEKCLARFGICAPTLSEAAAAWNRRAALASSPSAVPVGKMPRLPKTEEEMVALIGSNFSCLEYGDPKRPMDKWLYTMTVHDMLSMFDDLEVFDPLQGSHSQPQEPEAGEREPFSPQLADEFTAWVKEHYPTVEGATMLAMGDAWLRGRDTGYAKGREDAEALLGNSPR